MTTASDLIANRQFHEALKRCNSHPNECNIIALGAAIRSGAPPALIRFIIDVEIEQYYIHNGHGEKLSLMMYQAYEGIPAPLFQAINMGCNSEVILALVERYPFIAHIPLADDEPPMTPLLYLWFSEECRHLRRHGYNKAKHNQDKEQADICRKLWILFQASTQLPKIQRTRIQDPSRSLLDLDCVSGFAEPLPPDLLITLIEYLPLSVISRKDEKEWTVLHYHVRYVQSFKEEGYQKHLDEMDTNDALMDDSTPLIDEDDYSISGGSSFVGYNLVEEEDDDSIMDSEMSPHVSYTRYQQYSVVRALLKKFPEATRMLNDEGHTPLQIARPLDCLQALSKVEHRASSPSLLGM